MISLRLFGLIFACAALVTMGAAAALAQDPAAAPAPGDGKPAAVQVPPGQGEEGDLERAREAARKAPDAPTLQAVPDDKNDDLERARAAARAADPRLQGLEKAREAARKSADQNGGKDCLSAREARNAILAKRAVTLSQALTAARAAWNGEVIDYKLCTYDGALAYDLTLLNSDGKVGRVRVGAGDGKLVNVR